MLVECVPNFSCGAEIAKILAARVEAWPGVGLLGVESDPDHNRSVLTLAGEGPAALAVMRALLEEALARIDLSAHQGVHPRFGALDVAPFVPLGDTPMTACIELAEAFGAWAGEQGLPVYLYEQAARHAPFANLAALRKHLGGERRAPDFGPAAPHPRAGTLITGARAFLVAFNVNLQSTDLKLAKRIARAIRASSGGLPGVKALGLPLESRGQVQVSMNLCDYHQTGPGEVYDRIEAASREAGVEIADSLS